jgi:hypothetical protein
MFSLDTFDTLFVLWAFLFQLVLIVHFALRKWRFKTAIRYGPIVYALGVPALALSILLLLAGKPWWQGLGGFLYFAWAVFGYGVEYRKKIEWRSPIRWPIFAPYILLYLATTMFYWFPLARIAKPFWYGIAVLFAASTILNLTSHQPANPILDK